MADNIDLYRTLHNTHATYGTTANSLTPYIVPFAKDAAPRAILDYGCGKSRLCVDVAAQVGAKPLRYDPAIPEIANKPAESVDLVLNNDVLEHIPEPQLDDILGEIRSYSPKAVFTISTALADAMLENGENAHCTVRPTGWWRERLRKHFDAAYEVPTRIDDACAFVTWEPSAEAIGAAKLVRAEAERKLGWARRLGRVKNKLRLTMEPPLSAERLLAKTEGKSIAVVGNAASLCDTAYGEAIDAHDIVIRFNGVRLPHHRSHGRRTDWIATGIPFNAGTARALKAKTILWVQPSRRKLSPWMVRRKDADLYVHPSAQYASLGAKMREERPTCGAVVVDLLAQSPLPRQIDLYGFDFFASESLSGNHSEESAPHDFGRERAYIEALAQADQRLKINL